MATGLESAFDQQEDDVFAIDSSAPTTDIPAFGDLSNFKVDYSNIDLSSLDDVKLGTGITDESLDAFRTQLQDSKLTELGLTREDTDPSVLKDDSSFAEFYEEGLTDKNNQARQEFNSLYETDKETFAQEYDAADSNTRLNFLYDQFTAGELDKELYIELAGKTLQDSTEENFKPNTTYFENAGKLYEVSNQFLESKNPLEFAKEVVLFDDQKLAANRTSALADDTENFRRSLGAINQESADTRSSWVKMRDKVIIPMASTVGSILTGGQSDALFSGIKLASGETLTTADYANLASFGLEKFNIGSDLTRAAVDTAITGDPTQLVLQAGGADVVVDALGKAGVPENLLTDPDFISGVEKSITTVAQGGDLQDALEKGLGTYVKEGGGFGVDVPDIPDVDFGVVGDVVSNIASGVRDVGSTLGNVADPLLSTIGDVGSGIEDAVEPLKEPLQETGRFIDDTLLQPAKDALMGAGGAMLTGMTAPSSTRTTDGLFRDELFKFSPVEFTNVERVVQPEQQQIVEEEEEEMQDLFASPFTSPLDRYTV